MSQIVVVVKGLVVAIVVIVAIANAVVVEERLYRRNTHKLKYSLSHKQPNIKYNFVIA